MRATSRAVDKKLLVNNDSGIVNRPTLAVIGDGRNGGSQREAVVPLGQDETWTSVVATRLAEHMGNNGSQAENKGQNTNDRPLEVILQIGETKLAKAVVSSINKLAKQEGRAVLNM